MTTPAGSHRRSSAEPERFVQIANLHSRQQSSGQAVMLDTRIFVASDRWPVRRR
jgi:hypothetical protein